MRITLAKSKAGHDKNHIYVICKEDKDMVSLANGVTKTLECPKRKKRIHIQPIKNLPRAVEEICESEDEINDILIKRIVTAYEKHLSDITQSQFSK